jgi:hypothetical protein
VGNGNLAENTKGQVKCVCSINRLLSIAAVAVAVAASTIARMSISVEETCVKASVADKNESSIKNLSFLDSAARKAYILQIVLIIGGR